MPAAKHITVEMLLAETRRIGSVMQRTYPDMVKAGKIPGHVAAQRLELNKELVSILQQAANSKKPATQILTLFNQLL
jgi:hypothetical protein